MGPAGLSPQFNGLPLHGQAPTDPQQIDRVARDLEGVFARMMVSAMRDASFGDSLFPNENTHFRDMYDAKVADALTQGDGLGLAPMIRRQLGGDAAAQPALGHVSATGFPLDNYVRPLAAVHALPLEGRDHRATGGTSPAASPLLPTGPSAHSPGLSPGPSSGRTGFSSTSDAIREAASTRSGPSLPSYRNPDLAAVQRRREGGAQGPEAFVERIWPHAQRAAAELGVDPKVIVAQAALETGWGRRPIGGSGNDANNLFGIKATNWSGRSVAQSTREVYDGVETREVARFRAYDSIEQSFQDYVALLKNSPRYADAVGMSDGRQFARALQRAGYATDPQYAAKLTAIAEGPTMRRALNGLQGTPTLAEAGPRTASHRG